MVILIIIIVLILIIASFFIKNFKGTKILIDNFNRCNCIVFGAKGTGKDILFQKVINKRNKAYYSNINYGGNFNQAHPKLLELGNNTYNNLINDNIEIIDKNLINFEKKDFYFSDCGIILPSQYDNLLHKEYKGFTISYALSRQLWNNNIHCNTQSLDRIWKALREQADFYILCKKTTNIFGLLKVNFIVYDKYKSAQEKLSPLTNRVWNKYSKTEKDLYTATNGLVEQHYIFIRKKKIKYDTREYHNKIFGKKA